MIISSLRFCKQYYFFSIFTLISSFFVVGQNLIMPFWGNRWYLSAGGLGKGINNFSGSPGFEDGKDGGMGR